MEETKGNFVNLSAIADIWKDFDLLKLEDDFTEICEKYDFRISEMEYPLIMLHAGVSIERMLNHNSARSRRRRRRKRGERSTRSPTSCSPGSRRSTR